MEIVGDTSIKQWIENFDAELYDSSDVVTQCNAGWYDWFCRDNSLRNKTYKLAPKVKQIVESTKVDKEKMYVFFKNNCPVDGSLYDDFRICDLASGDVVYTVTPNCGHKATPNDKKSQVWGKENNFDGPLVEGTWKDVRKFFGV